jgi:ribosomal protein S18 acetylase RimI-like enzyme
MAPLLALYNSVGWVGYTAKPLELMAMVANSTFVQSCWEGERLVGLARVVSDDFSIMYLQDILVDSEYHRKGIGRGLVKRCLERFEHVRQKVLLTDDRPEQIAFYHSLGFHNTRDLVKTPLNAFIQIKGAKLS